MRIRVAQIGARRHYAVPVALHRAGLLESLQTDWCANTGLPSLVNLLPTVLRKGPLRRIDDRRVPTIPGEMIATFPRHAWQMSRLRKQYSSSNYDYWALANAAFGHRVVERGFGQADAVYGFNAAAAEMLTAARSQGLRTILDQTMAPWQPVETALAEERRRWPGWEIETSDDDSWRKLADRESQEWEAADLIICGSQYVVDSVAEAGGPAERCRVVPYGYDGPRACDADVDKPRTNRPLRVLFVGTLDLRKGVPYLMEAAKSVGRQTAEVRLVGPVRIQESAANTLREFVEVIGPVPRSEVTHHYEWADVFVLPTLAEGSANVCYEAMAHGVPVITTPNAGSVVRDGVDGWIIPARDARAITECIKRLANDRDRLCEMSQSARERAAEFTWDRYMQELATTISMGLSPTKAPASTLTIHN